MKKVIRLTESDLHRIVRKSVNRILRESNGRRRHRLTEDIYVGRGGGYYGNSPIFTVRMDDDSNMPTSYEFSPAGWDFDTESQLEAAAICASSNKDFLQQIMNSELNQLPVAPASDEDKGEALYWLTGGNVEWNHGYWAENGAEWSEAEEVLLADNDIMEMLNNAISSSNNFCELVMNLRKGEYMVYAADVVPTHEYDEDEDEDY